MPMNMGHCRFWNTLAALRECHERMDDELSKEEAKARNELLLLCDKIASHYAHEIELMRKKDRKRT